MALKIAPEYDGLVLWVKDASQNPLLAARLLNPLTHDELVRETNERYARLREEYRAKQQQLASLAEARNNKLNLFD